MIASCEEKMVVRFSMFLGCSWIYQNNYKALLLLSILLLWSVTITVLP